MIGFGLGACIKVFKTYSSELLSFSQGLFKEQGEPFVFNFKKLLKAESDKALAQSEVDAFMENCAKRWQTKEGTYQLKRRRLQPDVRDSPEYPGADIDMADI